MLANCDKGNQKEWSDWNEIYILTKMFSVVTLLVFNYGIDFNQLWQYALHCAMAQNAKQYDIL